MRCTDNDETSQKHHLLELPLNFFSEHGPTCRLETAIKFILIFLKKTNLVCYLKILILFFQSRLQTKRKYLAGVMHQFSGLILHACAHGKNIVDISRTGFYLYFLEAILMNGSHCRQPPFLVLHTMYRYYSRTVDILDQKLFET